MPHGHWKTTTFVGALRLEGMRSQESESQAFLFRIRHRGDIERIAIVGESKWRSAATEIGTIVDAEVRLYDTRSEDEAMRWLRND